MRSPRTNKRRRYLDVHIARPKRFRRLSRWLEDHRVVNLKPTFYERYPLGVVLALVVAGAGLFFAQKFLTRAEVADFHPATCLGEWQNPHLAQGEPQNLNSKEGLFSDENSSVYAGGNHKVFCGNFVPDDFEARGNIQNVGLTLLWQVGERAAPAEEISTSTSRGDDMTPLEDPDPASGEPVEPVEGSLPPAPPQPAIKEAPPAEPEPPPSGEIPEPTNNTTTVPIPESSKLEILKQRTASLLQFFFKPASAQEAGTGEGIIIEEPPALPDPVPPEGGEEDGDASSSTAPLGGEENATSTTATSTIPEPIIEEPPDENFLKVTYSLDGQSWEELARVHTGNWEFFTLTIPVNAWEDLRKLQVGIEGIDTALTSIPRTYLDGMLVEVHYEVPPVLSPPPQNPESAPREAAPKKPVVKIFDPESRHRCSITPFSQNIQKGASATYTVTLTPSSQDLHFELETGDLPPGVSAVFDPKSGVGSSTPALTLTAADSAGSGSFDVVAVYREIDQSFKVLTNFCQLNLIVK
ncbi:MAG: hypothetical protein HY435_00445 [Candidatus Liptonbacteria bacterium]|nr:hypothetical protein [Candidatus Liptonbacteria bacterium]